LKKVSFRYSSQMPYVLKQLNLSIVKGSRVGFIGTTGSGKSTLLDIIMGLLQPTDGTLEIDGQAITFANNRSWQAHIAHVPQAIFLADSSIEENIAFGVPKDQIDFQRVRQAAQQAQIAESIESWPDQYQTFVGERGIRLSGGQRQRIGIARALYKKADVIIFDEATSALDNETEQAVMQAIEGLSKDLTLLIIAHRLSTLKNCTQIVELGEGCIKRAGSYHDIVNQAKLTVIKHAKK
jgi:ATP-binding cassette subfamily B protein